MATPIFLTPGDAKILAKLIEREKSVPTTTAPRTPLDMQWTEGQDGPSPRTYIAIPQDVVPGSTSEKISFGICDVYQVDELTQQMFPAGFEITVYNPSVTDLLAEPIGITRDKFGKWIPLGGGGDPGSWAVVVSKVPEFPGAFTVVGRYICHEVQWINGFGAKWRQKPGGRIYTNCYEASTRSNANFERTRENIVHLYPANAITDSGSLDLGSELASLHLSSGISSALQPEVVNTMMLFDKGFGVIKDPQRV